MDITQDPRVNHRAIVDKHILAEECGELLRQFFKNIRKKKKISRTDDNTNT